MMTTKKHRQLTPVLCGIAAILILAGCASAGTAKEPLSTAGITDKGGGLYWLDAKEAGNAKDYHTVTGFEITVELVTSGSLGPQQPVYNQLFTANGTFETTDFALGFGEEYPPFGMAYIGTEALIASYSDFQYLSFALPTGKVDPNQVKFAVGKSVKIKYKGAAPLFTGENSIITVCGNNMNVMGFPLHTGVFAVRGVTWLY